jgi:hypothetical protein
MAIFSILLIGVAAGIVLVGIAVVLESPGVHQLIYGFYILGSIWGGSVQVESPVRQQGCYRL